MNTKEKTLQNDLVSVIIPTYKRADMIVRAVESALQQTSKTEVIVIDDNGQGTAEQQETETALTPYRDQILYLVNEKNLGPSGTRNNGIRKATGEFITFLDDDDEIDPKKLELQREYLNQCGPEYSCCYCDYSKLLQNGKTFTNGETVEGDAYSYMLGRMIYLGSGSNLLIRTKVLHEVGLFNEKMRRYEDYELMRRLLKNYKIAHLKQNLMTIHYEVRAIVPTFEDLYINDIAYFENAKNEITLLPKRQQNLIYQVAGLERWRYGLPRLSKKECFQILKENHVSVLLLVRYVLYLADRIIRKRSYGFKPF